MRRQPMRHLDKRSLFVAGVLMLAGCAEAPPAQPPKIARLAGATLDAGIPAAAASVSLDDIVAMAKHGDSAQLIIDKIDAGHAHYRLGAAQIAALIGRGVPADVIDHILAGERRRRFDDMAADRARRDEACQDSIERELAQCRAQALSPPGFATCWPPRPGPPYWRCF